MFKRFSLIFICFVFAVIFTYSRQPFFQFVPVMALPVSNKIIVIDAGHGTPDERC